MSNYLQRLIARAEGVASTPSLIPGVRRERARQQEPDPFAATLDAGEAFARQGPETTSAAPSISKLQPSGEETLAPSTASAPDNLSRLIRRSAPANETTEQEIEEARPAAPSDSSRRRQGNTSPEEIEASTRRIVEPLKMRDESAAHVEGLKSPDSDADEKRAQMLRPLNETEPLPVRKMTNDAEDEIRRTNQLSQEMLERLDRLGEVIERSSQVSSSAADTESRDASPFNLEPPRAHEEEARPAPPTDEPRLVIGQLRVDVIPSAPPAAREVVRVVTRNAGQNRSSSMGSQTSKLRFGLGQM
jgi:hypothetical protein